MSDDSSWLQKCRESLSRELGRVYDEVIIAGGLERELKRREELYQQQYKEELKKRDEDRQALSARFIEETIKNSGLIDDISILKAQLHKFQAKAPASGSDGDLGAGDSAIEGQKPNATVPCEEYRHLADKYNDLNRAHQETLKQLKYQQKKNQAVMEKNREMKKNVKDWQEFSDRHMKRKAKSEAKFEVQTPAAVGSKERENSALPTVSSPKSSSIRSPAGFSALDKSSALPISPDIHGDTLPRVDFVQDYSHLEEHDMSRPQEHSHSTGINFANNATIVRLQIANNFDQMEHTRKQSSANLIPSSQVTEDEIIEADISRRPEMAAGEDDDIPQVVSERSLKRKRRNTVKLDVHPVQGSLDGTPAKPYAVKDEQFSSPPAPSTRQLLRNETLDLDELGPNVVPTSHGRLVRSHFGVSNITGLLRQERSASVPIVKEEFIESGDQETSVDNAQCAPKATKLEANVTESRAFSEPTDQTRVHAYVLHKLDPNVRSMQQAQPPNDLRPPRRRRREDSRTVSAYQTVTESGDELPPLDENDNRLPPSAARARFNRRLVAGKDAQTPTRGVSKMHALATSAGRQTRQIPTPPHSTATSADTPSSRPGSHKGPLSNSRLGPKSNLNSGARPSNDPRPGSRKEPAPGRKKEPPLRTKRLSELKASDFKPNPASNHGHSYAFSETVRKRADRACMPGCTRSDCCGSTFRAMASALPPLTWTQEEELLEDFLGDAYDTMSLSQMAPKERQEFVLQARTRDLANKSGKHRQAFARRPSPPGYWRTDFPTTQEEQEDKAKAAEIEKRIIEERYMEAMRKGGQWMFRDE